MSLRFLSVLSFSFALLAIAYGTSLHQAYAQSGPTTSSVETSVESEQSNAPTNIQWINKLVRHINNLMKKPATEQEKAMEFARQGHYDEALSILAPLYQKDKNNQSVMRDYTAVLSWSGQDQKAIDVYQKLLPSQQSDYVLAAIGHSYRELNQPDSALATYQTGLKLYPNNVIFSEGIVRCLIDKGEIDKALSEVNDALGKQGERPELLAVKKEITDAIAKRDDQIAVQLGREKHYVEALSILSNLYAQHGDDVDITRDYLAILGWAGTNDDEVIALYKTLPSGDQPDYVLEAVGHSYRKLHQPNEAFQVYQIGVEKYPDNVAFAEGRIRCLADQGKFTEALAMANEDIDKHGERFEITDIRKNILRIKASATHHKSKSSSQNL